MTAAIAQSPNTFEAFNARFLSPVEVAATFIPPRQFGDLCSLGNCLVIGPRGSGKTTLLKMLQLPALAAWRHPGAARYLSEVNFTGVFIPADVSWGAQLQSLGGYELGPELRERFGRGAFTTHILSALVDAMRDTTSRELSEHAVLGRHSISLSRDQEAILSQALAKGWLLSPDVPSFSGLKVALRERLSLIARGAYRARLKHASQDESLGAALELDPMQTASLGIEAFNELVGQPQRRWALLFDELEIAPESIRRLLLISLRSIDQRIVFKLSLSPYSEDMTTVSDSQGPMRGEDYIPVELWYSHKEDAYDFSIALLSMMLRSHGCPDMSPEAVFGTSDFELGRQEQRELGSAYKPGSATYNRFRILAEIDSTFARYLAAHKINLRQISSMRDDERAGFVRKITSLVAVRHAFRRPQQSASSDGNVVIRSRKNPRLYTGAWSVFAIAEGNPRWFIGMLGPLIREYADSLSTVRRSSQAKAIAIASTRFRALLSTIAVAASPPSPRYRGLIELLDKIGEYFFSQVVVSDFTPEPPLTFVVDSATPKHILDAVGKALNAGAIVHIPERPGEVVLGSLVGKRFRITYLLAPYYKLPLTLGKGRALSRILERTEAGGLFAAEDREE